MAERVKLAMVLEHFVRKIQHAIENAIEVRVGHLPHTVPRLGASLPKHGDTGQNWSSIPQWLGVRSSLTLTYRMILDEWIRTA